MTVREPPSAAALLGLGPGSRIHGRPALPGSKSEAQRALLAAALAAGSTRLEGLSDGDDVRAARGLVAALGAEARSEGPGTLTVTGTRPGGGPEPRGPLVVGESGTLARLATAAVALAGRPGARWTVQASGTLLFRKSPPLFHALTGAGVALLRQNLAGTWPVELVSAAPPAEVVLASPVSSQEVSGLVLALAAHPETRVLRVRGPIPSEPYLRITERVLAAFGARVAREDAGGEARFTVTGPLTAPETALAIEPDASAAAVVLAAACLSGGEVLVPGLGPASPQGDVRIVEHLAAFGCAAEASPEGLRARGFPARGAVLDLGGQPDLAPVLAAVAAGAALRHDASSVLTGLGTLPGKESDRLGGLARALDALGCTVEAGTDALGIGPPTAAPPRDEALILDPRGDHRMAFAFALLGLLEPRVRVRDPGCVAKSWTGFWDALAALGAVLVTG